MEGIGGAGSLIQNSDYVCFVDAWFRVYDELKSVIDVANLSGYPYKVRVLDRLLWYLGQPNFDAPCADDFNIRQ
jgi:hypothetical protein